jgi:hypothetical protein
VFASGSEQLAASGILYPETGRAGFPAHFNLGWGLLGDERFDPALGFLDELEAELRRKDAPKVLLSSEDFECLYDKPHELRRLRAVLVGCGYVPHVALVLREEPEYLESLYLELVKNGLMQGHNEFVAQANAEHRVVFRAQVFCLDYETLADGFRDVFGEEHVSLLPYDPVDMVGTFFRTFEGFFGESAGSLPIDVRENTRTSSIEILMARLEFAESEVAVFTQKIADMEEWIEGREGIIVGLEEVIEALRDSLGAARDDLAATLEDLERANQENAALRQTLSWRITRPLRRLRARWR